MLHKLTDNAKAAFFASSTVSVTVNWRLPSLLVPSLTPISYITNPYQSVIVADITLQIFAEIYIGDQHEMSSAA